MKKNILKSTLVVAALAIAGYGGEKAYNSYAQNEPFGLLAANIEALSNPEGQNGQYPRYINKTDKNSYKEFKSEVKVDSTGVSVTVQYSRTCTTYYTYCKHTGKKEDICYESLNGMKTDCGDWSKS